MKNMRNKNAKICIICVFVYKKKKIKYKKQFKVEQKIHNKNKKYWSCTKK